jgi:ElaB/YqjD/DUF883 family membrane-anchored ribosome-binding protein
MVYWGSSSGKLKITVENQNDKTKNRRDCYLNKQKHVHVHVNEDYVHRKDWTEVIKGAQLLFWDM